MQKWQNELGAQTKTVYDSLFSSPDFLTDLNITKYNVDGLSEAVHSNKHATSS